jgi:hypothetical protein
LDQQHGAFDSDEGAQVIEPVGKRTATQGQIAFLAKRSAFPFWKLKIDQNIACELI